MLFKDFLTDQVIYQNGHEKLQPKISVITPTYCRIEEGLLQKCIDSVLAQTYNDFEFIIIDDGSVDGSQRLIQSYAQKDERIVYIRHENNSGLPAVRTNEGILAARGKYIAFVFDDNVLEPRFLATLLESAEKCDTDIQYCTLKIFRDTQDFFTMGDLPSDPAFLYNLNTIPNGAVLCKRSMFDMIGLYDAHLAIRRICDWDLWIRAYRAGLTFTYIDECLSTEYGVASSKSIGNTVYLDYKITYAYMMDEAFGKTRNQRLKPENIAEYDVFDIDDLLPFACNYDEIRLFFDDVYQGFFKSHPDITNNTVVPNTVFYPNPESKLLPFNHSSIVGSKPRIVIACMMYNETVEMLKQLLLRQMPNAIVLTCTDYQFSYFETYTVDLILVVDSAEQHMQIARFKEMRTQILYVVGNGNRPASKNAKDYFSIPSVQLFYRAVNAYLSQRGMPWNEEQAQRAAILAANSDFIVNDSGAPLPDAFASLKAIPIELLENVSMYHFAVLAKNLVGKKILIFINSHFLAGSEIYGILMVQLLSRFGFDTKLCIAFTNRFPIEDEEQPLVKYVEERGLSYEFVELTRGANLDNGVNPTLVTYMREQNAGLVINSSLMAEVIAAAYASNVPSVSALFSPANYRAKELNIISRNLGGVISDCQWTCDIYNKYFNLDAVRILDVLEDHKYLPFKPLRGKTVTMASAGTLQPRKRQFEIVKAAHMLIEAGYDIHLNLYGYHTAFKDYSKQIADYIQKHRLQNRITVHGFVEDGNEIIKNNDMIVSASVEESMPQGVLFHMAAGLVGVACPVSGISEIIDDNATGYLAGGFSVEELFEALRRALDDRENWPEVVESAHKLLHSLCDIDVVSDGLIRYLAKKVEQANVTFQALGGNARLEPVYAAPPARYVPPEHVCASKPLNGPREYEVTLFNQAIHKIGLMFCCLDGKAAGTLRLEVFFKGQKIRESSIDMSHIVYHIWTYFDIDPLFGYAAQRVTLRLTPEYTNAQRLCLLEDQRNRTFYYKVRSKLRVPIKGGNVPFFELR